MDQEEEEQISSSHHWMLPSKSFDGLWESLIFSVEIKSRVYTSNSFHDYQWRLMV